MGEPIRLYKDNETVTVYGQSQAAELLADGYQLTPPEIAETEPDPEPVKTAVTKPATRRKRGN